MHALSRRTFIAETAAMSALPAGAELPGSPERTSLAAAWPTVPLIPRTEFHPFPDASERAAWQGIPSDARARLIAAGESQLKGAWETLPASLFLEYKRTGNRARYEAARDVRRNRLQSLVIAECLEGRGRFADEIVNGIWLTCEETYWGLPAHVGIQKAGTGLPDAAEPTVDLFAAETAHLLAWTEYLIAPALERVSPLVTERIRLETGRRVLTPCLERDDFWWMGLQGEQVNNWNPWICSNWLTAALLVERDEARRQAAVSKILKCLDKFLSFYAPDGGCDEGPVYWGRAGASLFDCLDLLDRATGGRTNGFSLPLVHQIGLYICRAHIHNEWYTNFADSAARVYPDGDLIYRFGERLSDSGMMEHGAFVAFFRDEQAVPKDAIGRQLPALFNLPALRRARRAQALLRDVWFPGVQVMAARRREGSAEGLYLAAQGGHNAESHNHNDVGNFLVYADGHPAIIDVGVETYSAKTFSPQRYEIWTMQSAYHNCPTIDGVMQSAGRQFAAADVQYRADDAGAELRLNLAAAYPVQAHVKTWRRTLRLDRVRNEVEVTEEYALESAPKEITLTLMTPCVADSAAAGVLSLAMPQGGPVRISYDARAVTPKVEEIRIEDPRLQASWGKRLFRILLRAEHPPAQGRWRILIARQA